MINRMPDFSQCGDAGVLRTDGGVGCAEHDSGVEEGAGDTRGDRDQLALPGEDLDLSRASEFWEVYGASGADSGGTWFVRRDGWELGQQFAGVNEKGIEPRLAG